MAGVSNYNKINRFWGSDSVSAARKIDKSTSKSQKASTCDKLNNLLKVHPNAGITVIKALVDFKKARDDSWFCIGRTDQSNQLNTIDNTLKKFNFSDLDNNYPTLKELEVLVKNSSYFVQRDIPTHFKNFLIALTPDVKKQITDSGNQKFLQDNGIIDKPKSKTKSTIQRSIERVDSFTKQGIFFESQTQEIDEQFPPQYREHLRVKYQIDTDQLNHVLEDTNSEVFKSCVSEEESSEHFFSFVENNRSIEIANKYEGGQRNSYLNEPQRDIEQFNEHQEVPPIRVTPSKIACALNAPKPANQAQRQALRNAFITEVIIPYRSVVSIRLKEQGNTLNQNTKSMYTALNSMLNEITSAIQSFNGYKLSLALNANNIQNYSDNIMDMLEDENLPITDRGYVAALLAQICLVGLSPFSKFNIYRLFDTKFAKLWNKVLGEGEYAEALKQNSEQGQLREFLYTPYIIFMQTISNPEHSAYSFLMQTITKALASRDEKLAEKLQSGWLGLNFIQQGAEFEPLAFDPLTFDEFNSLQYNKDIFALGVIYLKTDEEKRAKELKAQAEGIKNKIEKNNLIAKANHLENLAIREFKDRCAEIAKYAADYDWKNKAESF
jgi:hypothetical protein